MSTSAFNQQTGFHNRQSIRLPGYDYSRPGYYFVTVCAFDRIQNPFGVIVDQKTILNASGIIIENEILKTERMRPSIKIDEYIIIPDHVHIIIQIRDNIPSSPTSRQFEKFGKPTSNSIPTIVRLIKSTVTKKITNLQNPTGRGSLHEPELHEPELYEPELYEPKSQNPNVQNPNTKTSKSKKISIWQRNYYEHIIRDERSIYFIRKYIRENPAKWVLNHEKHIDNEIDELEMTEFVCEE